MQTASELKKKGVKRTKVTRDDGHVFVTLESLALARTIFTPADGFTSVTEVYGYDADLDGPPRKRDVMVDLFVKLDQDELNELATRLENARSRALELKYEGLDDEDHEGFEDPRYVAYAPVYGELDSVYMLVFNECNARDLGCRWSACVVCRHESCVFCPACNPGEIAPSGDCYDDDDAEETPTGCCH